MKDLFLEKPGMHITFILSIFQVYLKELRVLKNTKKFQIVCVYNFKLLYLKSFLI
jgi:hypothetical protein